MENPNYILQLIKNERIAQNEKWGKLHHSKDNHFVAMSVLSEEVGEVARAILEKDLKNLEEELIQVAAVCVKWLQSLENNMNFIHFHRRINDFFNEEKDRVLRKIKFGENDEDYLYSSSFIDIINIDFDNFFIDENDDYFIIKHRVFTGDERIFQYQPNESIPSLPEWSIVDGSFCYKIENTLDPEELTKHIDGIRELFKSHILNLNSDITKFNQEMEKEIKHHLSLNKSKNKIEEEVKFLLKGEVN